MALRGRRVDNFLELWCLVALGGLDIWVSSISFKKSQIRWPQQPQTEKVLKIHLDISWWLRDIRVPDFSVHNFSPRLYSPVVKWTLQSKTFQSWTFQFKTFQSWTFQSKTLQSWAFQSKTLQSNGKMNFSVPDFSVLNFTVQDISVLNFTVPDFSVLNFSVPDLSVPDFTVPRAKWTLQSKTKTTTFWVLFYFFW